jgi:transposase
MELNRVKRELAEVKMERDLLKKHLKGRAPARRAETPRHKYTDAHQGERPLNYC